MIVLLILAGISIAMLTGENGILTKASTAKDETKKAQYKEALGLIGIELRQEQILENLSSKDYMDRYEEEIEKEMTKTDLWEGATQERKNNETIWVQTKEGWLYKIVEEEVIYFGTREENPVPPDLVESDIEFRYSTDTFTNQDITVEVELKREGGILEYSTDGETWKVYDKTIGIVMKQNGTIYVRLKNNLEETGKSATTKLTWIDKLPPKNFKPTVNSTETSITVTGTTTDQEETIENASSGINKYYFSKDNGATWVPENGQTTNSYRFDGVSFGTSFNIKMKVVDKAGNEYITEAVTASATKPVSSLEVGQYVNYVDKTGTTRLCRVLWNESPYGIQILTVNCWESVTFGNTNDLYAAIDDYNKAFTTLHDLALKYLDGTIAYSARSVGCEPDNPVSDRGYKGATFCRGKDKRNLRWLLG